VITSKNERFKVGFTVSYIKEWDLLNDGKLFVFIQKVFIGRFELDLLSLTSDNPDDFAELKSACEQYVEKNKEAILKEPENDL
jgi:hypothetical protein